ncbi:MAG: hypothetical protein FWH27_05175 [Planctomycetaceae bacterium]|nr:hypothetical protein [Planctomycetaceae bacterium]
MSELIHQCMTKGVIAEGDQLQHGPNWLLARRGKLKLYQDRLECGNWRIEYRDVKKATLYAVRQYVIVIPIPGYVLKVETEDQTYYFGLNASKYWKKELPFPVERQKGRLRFSLFSVVVRLIFLGYIVYLLWWMFFYFTQRH